MLPGIDGTIMTVEGKPCAVGEKGIFVIRRPFPGLTATLWGDPERYGAVATGTEPGDISTIEDEGSVAEARESWQRMKEEVAAQRTDG